MIELEPESIKPIKIEPFHETDTDHKKKIRVMWGKVGIVLRFFENFSARMKFFFIFIIFLLHCSLWLLNSIGIVLLCDLQRVEKALQKSLVMLYRLYPTWGKVGILILDEFYYMKK